MKHLFSLLIFAICWTFSLSSFCQTVSIQPNQPITDIWTSVEENDLLKVSYKLTDCNVPKDGHYASYAFLQFENKTNKKITVSWEPELFYNNSCVTCNATGIEKKYTLTLLPNQILTSNCDFTDDIARKLQVFIKWTQIDNKRTLSSFSIKNLDVKIKH